MKKIIIVLGTIVTVFLMVSVVTAIPCINSKTRMENKNLLTELKEKTEDIKKKNYSGGTAFELMCATIIFLGLLFYFLGLEIIALSLAKVYEFLNCPLPHDPSLCPCSSSKGG